MEKDKEVEDTCEEYKKQTLNTLVDAFNEGYRLGCRAAQQINN